MVEYGVALLVVAALGVGTMQSIGSKTQDSVIAACFTVNGEVAC